MRNPDWTRDEHILAFDFYMRYRPKIPTQNSKEIIELSAVLGQLGHKIWGSTSETFRNPDGVYLKMMNFRSNDPTYDGIGMSRGSKDELLIWELFGEDQNSLIKSAILIRAAIEDDTLKNVSEDHDDDAWEHQEGSVYTAYHKRRERKDVKSKKIKDVLAAGKTICCEACDFDFEKVYGSRGRGFIECHHVTPVSEMKPNKKTRSSDLALLCANCHRMIHSKRPWLTIQELKNILEKD